MLSVAQGNVSARWWARAGDGWGSGCARFSGVGAGWSRHAGLHSRPLQRLHHALQAAVQQFVGRSGPEAARRDLVLCGSTHNGGGNLARRGVRVIPKVSGSNACAGAGWEQGSRREEDAGGCRSTHKHPQAPRSTRTCRSTAAAAAAAAALQCPAPSTQDTQDIQTSAPSRPRTRHQGHRHGGAGGVRVGAVVHDLAARGAAAGGEDVNAGRKQVHARAGVGPLFGRGGGKRGEGGRASRLPQRAGSHAAARRSSCPPASSAPSPLLHHRWPAPTL